MRNDVWAVYECDNGGNKFPSYLISSLSARFPDSRISDFPESLGEPLRHYLESFTLLVLFSIALLFPIEHLILREIIYNGIHRSLSLPPLAGRQQQTRILMPHPQCCRL